MDIHHRGLLHTLRLSRVHKFCTCILSWPTPAFIVLPLPTMSCSHLPLAQCWIAQLIRRSPPTHYPSLQLNRLHRLPLVSSCAPTSSLGLSSLVPPARASPSGPPNTAEAQAQTRLQTWTSCMPCIRPCSRPSLLKSGSRWVTEVVHSRRSPRRTRSGARGWAEAGRGA